MGSHELTTKPPGRSRLTTMKVLVVLALLGCAFARPAYEYVDPDCIEEDLAIAEPGAYDSALGEPELVINFDNEQGRSDSDNFDDCEDQLTTEEVQTLPPVQKQEVTEECEDALTTEEVEVYNEPVFTDPPVVHKQAPTEECEDALTTEEVFVSDPPAIVFTDPPVAKQVETEPGCVDEVTDGPTPPPTTAEEKQYSTEPDCIDDEPAVTEENPFLNFHVEKAIQESVPKMFFDSPNEEIEECDDY